MKAIGTLGLGLVAGIGLAGAAAAQQAPADSQGDYREVDESQMIERFGMTADEIEEMDLFGPTGEQIGEVEEVLAGPDGQPTALVVETEELLGLGGKEVVLGFDRVEIVDRLVTSIEETELETLPEWEG